MNGTALQSMQMKTNKSIDEDDRLYIFTRYTEAVLVNWFSAVFLFSHTLQGKIYLRVISSVIKM